MATSQESRLAPETARDGVDTRTKENWGSVATVNRETTSLRGVAQGLGEQTAAVTEFDAWLDILPCVRLDLVAPTGAEVEGAPLWGVWGRYETVAKRHMEDSDESFRWVSYQTQVERAEEELLCCVPESRQMEMLHLNDLNRAITSLGNAIAVARRELRTTPFLLDFHKTRILSRMDTVSECEAVCFPAPIVCTDCGWGTAQYGELCVWCHGKQEEEEGWRGTCGCGEVELCDGLCADCYWDMRAQRKQDCREGRSLLPPPPIRLPPPAEEPEEEEDDNSHLYERVWM